ncbi:unnamed protein product [Zymoseptoria tritici ST99CH_1A5]|uniref:WSC domain-containing protein n=2 Tax=Zymoseptoria tritici TaxID=1047171 RepID=A0A2H1GPJ0_ZYMTR|nr:unnamed protein product [Zymoseptoria tritici ST99CH_1E4]SMY26219.1 unnamed protein product [Zymoseptoria tritici ST99CH_1A5]
MRHSFLSPLAGCLVSFSLHHASYGLNPTDTITWGGDTSRAGYESNHNLDPRVIASADWGNIWTAKLPGAFAGLALEQVLSQPLVYTTDDGIQYVFVATTQNNLYKINAKTGEVVTSRNIGVPFMAADLGSCFDITPCIGVTGTGVIDPSSGLWYLTSKTYSDQFQNTTFGPKSSPGRANGRYYFHAINTSDLSEAPNFPVSVGGTVFRNNPRRQLIAGDQHQRPALLQVGNFIYTGWASHCIQYNYTGAIIGFHKTSGAIVEAYAMEGGEEPNTVAGGGVWMSGGGLAYDGAGSMFFSTGNGYAAQLPANGSPVGGRNPPTALEEAVVNMRINNDGTIQPVDFFMPWEKTQLDGADKDLGTTPFQLLPSSFTCPNSRRIGMVTGKSGKTYWLNVDNLGGYQMGANRLDAAIQVFQHENSVYSAAGIQPLGGYIYINVNNQKTRVLQFSCNANGDATFVEVTTTAEKSAQYLGVGHGTTTSLNGQPGTGLYWMTDVDGLDLRIYDATPPSDGSPLKLLRGFNIQGPGKFNHPVFGDGRAYVAARGSLWAFGAPVNLPLNCTSPIAFPRTAVNSTSTPIPVTCVANVATSVTSFNILGNPNFVASGLPTLPLALAAGDSFQFQAQFAPMQVGPLSSDVVINTTNAVAGSSSRTPVTLTGTASSTSALLNIQPITLTFNTTIGAGAVSKSVFWNNDGDAALTVSGVSFSVVSEQGPWFTPNTTSDGGSQVAQFTFSDLPSSIGPGSQQSVGVVYNPPAAGNHAVFVKIVTSGGTKILDVFGTVGSQPVALYEFQRADGSGWDPYVPGQNFSFGDVAAGTVRTLALRITNNGSSTASPLGLTVSKPPFDAPGYLRASNGLDLAEGTQIAAAQSANATLYCAPPEVQPDMASSQASAAWRINTNNDQGAVVLGFLSHHRDLIRACRFCHFFHHCLELSNDWDLFRGCLYERAIDDDLGASFRDHINFIHYFVGQLNQHDIYFTAFAVVCSVHDPVHNSIDDCVDWTSYLAVYYAVHDTFFDAISNFVHGSVGDFINDCFRGEIYYSFDNLIHLVNLENDLCERNKDKYHNQSNNGNKFEIDNDKLKNDDDHAQPNKVYTNETLMTVNMCASEAKRRDFKFMGVESGKDCWMGDTIDAQALPLSQSKCSTPCPGSKTTACGGSQALQMYQVNSTLLRPKRSSPSPLSCPAADDTVYTARNGARYRIECGWDRKGGTFTLVSAATYEACLNACSTKTGCKSVALVGNYCYLKTGTLPSQYRNDAVRGATLVTK